MKKVISILLIFVMSVSCCGLLSSCGDDNDPYATKSYGNQNDFPNNYQEIRTDMYEILTEVKTADGDRLRDVIAESSKLTKSLTKLINDTVTDAFLDIDGIEDIYVSATANQDKNNMVDITVKFTYTQTGATDTQTTSFSMNGAE